MGQTTLVSEPLAAGDARKVYAAGDVDETVTLLHTGDASGDVLISVGASGKIAANAGVLTRDVPFQFRLAAGAAITATSTAGSRTLTIAATPIDEIKAIVSSEDELFKLRCLTEQILIEAIMARERLLALDAAGDSAAALRAYEISRARGLPETRVALAAFTKQVVTQPITSSPTKATTQATTQPIASSPTKSRGV